MPQKRLADGLAQPKAPALSGVHAPLQRVLLLCITLGCLSGPRGACRNTILMRMVLLGLLLIGLGIGEPQRSRTASARPLEPSAINPELARDWAFTLPIFDANGAWNQRVDNVSVLPTALIES